MVTRVGLAFVRRAVSIFGRGVGLSSWKLKLAYNLAVDFTMLQRELRSLFVVFDFSG